MQSELHQRLNDHLELEYAAAHQYLAMSIWFELNDLPGFAAWTRQQSVDELAHGRRIVDHLLERDLTVALPAIPEPVMEFSSAQDVVEAVLASEQKVTRSINDLYELAQEAHDRPASLMLDWFVSEQVEEENVARALLGRLRLAGDNSMGLLLVDQELAKGSVPGAAEGPEG